MLTLTLFEDGAVSKYTVIAFNVVASHVVENEEYGDAVSVKETTKSLVDKPCVMVNVEVEPFPIVEK